MWSAGFRPGGRRGCRSPSPPPPRRPGSLREPNTVPEVLEHHSNRDLHDAGLPRRDHLTEPRVHLVALRVAARRGVNRRELRVIEDVVDLPPQLQLPQAAAERDVLEER